jgi:hypothetical protein
MLVLAAALLLAAALASTIAIGQWLPITVDERPPRNDAREFRPVGMLPEGVTLQAIAPLSDGSALLLDHRDLYRFAPETERFVPAGRLQMSRSGPTTVALADGRVLIVGGGRDQYPHEPRPADGYRAELYDPETGVASLTGSTVRPRSGAAGTLLQDGRVLVTGGESLGAVPTAEIYDPRTGEFTETGPMSRPRSGHGSVLLPDGRVLVVGGHGSDAPPDAEVYDPASGRFAMTGPMAAPQVTNFSVTTLADGRVLFVGGWGVAEGGGPEEPTALAQVYDPSAGTFTMAGSLPAPRYAHGAALLDDGRVLVIGGWASDAVEEGDDVFVYDPETGTFTPTEPLGMQRLGPFVAKLGDGRVLVVGSQCWNPGCYGLDSIPAAADRHRSAEIFDRPRE